MTIDQVKKLCESFPQATSQVQWGNDLVFKVGGKMFAVTCLEPNEVWLSFKSAAEEFAELTERPDVRPAPYLARAHWVALERRDAMPAAELKSRLRQAYELTAEKLPKKDRIKLGL